MEARLVSVLTPVYNGESYITRLLDSVLGQTYPYIEMILADDGSTDATLEIAETYIPRFKEKGYSLTIISALHKNASAAINKGLSYVKGEYLVWPDSDDELLPDSVETRVCFLQQHPEYQCVRSVMEYVSGETGEPVKSVERLGDLAKTEIFLDVLDGRTFVCCGCYMFKTEPFFQIYPSRKVPEYDVGQNFQMLLPFLYQYQCPTIDQKLYRVYVRSDSHSRRSLSRQENMVKFKQFEQLLDEIAEICKIEDPAVLLRIALWKIKRRGYLAQKYHNFVKLTVYNVEIIYLYLRLWMVRRLCGRIKNV